MTQLLLQGQSLGYLGLGSNTAGQPGSQIYCWG